MAAPQQTKAQNDNTDKAQKQVVIQLTDEKKARLKSYFISGFKGIGGSVDCFEYLIIDLQKPRTGYGYAAIAKMIYKSKKATKYVQEMTFAKWYSEFCNIMGIEKKTYRPSQITITDVLKSEFYYLQ
jgi:hypothetical protein